MSLDEDLFAGDTLHVRSVKVGGGKEVTLHFRELPYTAFARFREQTIGTDQAAREGAIARLIADGVANPDGTPGMSFERALKLRTVPLQNIFLALMEVNGQGDDAGNASPSATNDGSGTSSPSRSAKPSGSSSAK